MYGRKMPKANGTGKATLGGGEKKNKIGTVLTTGTRTLLRYI